MPKHVSLSMTMHHVIGSSNIIELLSGFGHSVLHSTVLWHDTALTTQQLESCSLVPAGFLKNIPCMLVWDNNDFSEETASGEGTTHNTNGLLCQPSTSDDFTGTPEK